MIKKPISIIALAIFIAWGIPNTISTIFLRTDSADVLILNHYHLVWAGYILASLILILSIASLFSIFTSKKWGLKVLYLLFLINIIFTLFVAILSALDFESAKNAYAQSRISRGLSIENIEIIVTPTITIGMTLVYVVFYSFLALYVHKKREYFSL